MINLKIICVLFIFLLDCSLIISLSNETLTTKEIFDVNCCDSVDGSCVREDFPLLGFRKKWIALKEDIRERYNLSIGNDWCNSNTSTEVTLNVTDLLIDGNLYESDYNTSLVEGESNLTTSILESYQFDGFYYSSRDYCILNADEETLSLKLCKSSCESENEICIPKCCPLGKNLNISSLECVTGTGILNPTIYMDDTTPLSQNAQKNLKIRYRFFNTSCEKRIVSDYTNIESLAPSTIPSIHARMRFLKTGDLRLRLEKWRTLSQSKSSFCLESLIDPSNVLIALWCPQMGFGPDPILQTLGVVINITEAFFTLLTTVIYLLLWKTLIGNIHRLTQFFHVTSYGLLLLSKSLVLSLSVAYTGQISCVIVGIVTHYLALTTGSWMVLINWDLFITFWKMETGGAKKIKRIHYYCLFGWVAPLFPIILGFILTSLYGDDNDSNVILPEYGKYLCFTSIHAAYYYAYIPVVADYLIVVILFVTTLIIIYKHKSSTAFATTTKYQNRKNSGIQVDQDQMNNLNNRFSLTPMQKENFMLFAKLTVLSGLLGCLDIISLLPDEYHIKWKYLFTLHAIILDHILGFALFYLYVCNKTTLKQLRKQYPGIFSHCRIWTNRPSTRRSSIEMDSTVAEARI